MSKLTVTDFSKRKGSPFQAKPEEAEVISHKTAQEEQKNKQNELIQKVTKKAADYQAKKPNSGVFTEVVTHGVFSPKNAVKDNKGTKPNTVTVTSKCNSTSRTSPTFIGFPSSANDLALDAKTDLESDPSMSQEVKEKVIEKLFKLVSMVQHVYESKVRITTEYEKYKDTHLRNELRREKEHSEQLYKLNMNFQNEVVQSIQRLKSELDIVRNISKDVEERDLSSKDSSVVFNSEDTQDIIAGSNEEATESKDTVDKEELVE